MLGLADNRCPARYSQGLAFCHGKRCRCAGRLRLLEFSPSTLALSLLQPSTSTSHPGLDDFQALHQSLSTSLQSAVQGHFQSFAASLPAHASFLATLGRAQQQVRTSKDALKDARDGFAGKGKAELASIRAREEMVRDMLKILDTVWVLVRNS
jgi:exocyst complex component 4